MKLTKYGHACLVLEEQGEKLIIDPGELTPDFGDINNVVAVVVTHLHFDHLSNANLQKILTVNPGVTVFTTAEAAKEWGNPKAQAVKLGEQEVAGPFTLKFYGELHSVIHPQWPQNQNIGVMVNGLFYYPGDSFTKPSEKIKILAVPANAPWLKTAESIDFIKEVSPEIFFRTHDGLLNQSGLAVVDRWFDMAAEKFGHAYRPLNPGETIDV